MQKLTYLAVLLSFSLSGQIKFDSLTREEAIQASKDAEKLLFINAFANWCDPCEDMNEFVFSDLEVGNYFNRNFVNIQMNLEQYPGVDFAEKYKIDVYPSFMFFNSNNEVVHRGCGAMDAEDFLRMGETAMDQENNFAFFEKQYEKGDRSVDVIMNYFAFIESACLDVDRYTKDYLKSLKPEELTTDAAWAVLASYNWDIYSREFQYLLNNQVAFEAFVEPEAIQAKLYDTYLTQYQEVYEAEELHDFGMRSLLHSIEGVNFIGADTLKLMMKLHYAEFTEDWREYAVNAIDYVNLTKTEDPEQLSEIAWKFYLFIENRNQLEIAADWAKSAVEQLPDPSIIDTYASLQFKLGNKKKAVELGTKALEFARELYENVEHFEYQLERFKTK